MKKLFKTVTVAMTLVTTLFVGQVGAQTTVDFGNYNDINSYYSTDIDGHWALGELDDFINSDLLKGYKNNDGTIVVKPDQTIKRGEFASFIVRILDLKDIGGGKTFTDVKQGDWYYNSVKIANQHGIVNGVNDTEFAPNQEISRAAIASMLVRAFKDTVVFEGAEKTFSDINGHWGKNDILLNAKVGIIGGYTDGTFKPDGKAKRSEAFVMVSRALNKEKTTIPLDTTLEAVVETRENQEASILVNKNYDALATTTKNYTTGYNKSLNVESYNTIKELLSIGGSLDVTVLGTPKATVISKSNRFAKVKLTGTNYGIKVFDGKTTISGNESSDGTYYLKKTDDASWKIYFWE